MKTHREQAAEHMCSGIDTLRLCRRCVKARCLERGEGFVQVFTEIGAPGAKVSPCDDCGLSFAIRDLEVWRAERDEGSLFDRVED